MAAAIPLSPCRSRHVFARSFRTVLTEYLENSTIAGCKHLVDSRTNTFEKILWLVVIALSITGVAYMSKEIWTGYTEKPTFVSLESTQYPIWKVPFPAVAFCSANKISKRRVTQYSEYLMSKSGLPADAWLKNLHYLGRNIDHSVDDFEIYVDFMDYLGEFDANETSRVFDTMTTMRMLAPKCEDMILACRWMGNVVDCKSMFKLRRTMDGFCCTFNYVRSIDSLGSKVTESAKLSATTYLMGLMVILNPEVNDYYYSTRISAGVNVLVFDPHDYPDVNSGSLRERFVTVNMQHFISLTASTLNANPAVRRFTAKQRGCMFNDEMPDIYDNLYTYSNCVTRCRMLVMLALCKCLPFYMPASANYTICGLYDVPCLNKYTTKFRSVLAMDFEDSEDQFLEGFEEEREDGMYCFECLPSCTYTSYKIKHEVAAANRDMAVEYFHLNETPTDMITVFIYYNDFDTRLFKMDAVFYWFEIISNFGGIGGLFMGFSLISAIEFVYFFTLRLFAVTRQNGWRLFGKF